MNDPGPKQNLIEHVAAALILADQLGMDDVAIQLTGALSRLDLDHQVLRDSADRFWRLDD